MAIGSRDIRVLVDLSSSRVEASTEVDYSVSVVGISLSSLVVPLESFLEILSSASEPLTRRAVAS